MTNFQHIGQIDVVPLLLQLDRHPELWDAHDDRTTRDVTAHRGTSDIHLRYRPPDQLRSPTNYNEPFHDMVWYPAYHALQEIRPITQALMQRVGGTALGGCLITRIPSGGRVLPHSDRAAWHARFYATKVYIPLRSNARCVNWVEDEELVMQVGQCYVFDNLKTHAVVNDGNEDRVTLICSIRCD